MTPLILSSALTLEKHSQNNPNLPFGLFNQRFFEVTDLFAPMPVLRDNTIWFYNPLKI